MNPFPELNLTKFKIIAERWVQRFQKKGGWFNQIVLYRYAAPAYQEKTSLRWAVVFDIKHFEIPEEETKQEFLKNCVEGFFLDPYYYFIGKTGYGRWRESRYPEPEKGYGEELDPISLHGKRFLEQSGFAPPPVFVSKEMGFPQNLLESDFTDVYVDGAPENWQNQWLFVPLFKDCPFPDQIQTNESIILYMKLPAKRRGRKIVVSPRNEKAERVIWDRWIQPIINTHYNGSIKYRFFDKPEQITQADIENIFRQALSMLYQYPGMPFQGNDFLKEVLDRLLAGFKQHEGVDLVALFYGFLTKLMDDGQLPAFLAYIDQERHELSVDKPQREQSQFEIHTPIGTTWNQIHFRIVHSDRVEVTHPNGMTPFSPDEIGLLKKRRLHNLFERFAHEEYQDADRQDIYNLNKFLKDMFPDIKDGNPIIKNRLKKKSLKEEKDHLKLMHPTGYTIVFSIQ